MAFWAVPGSLREELADTPGLVYREAVQYGKVVYEVAGEQ